MDKTEKHPGGAPTLYKEEYNEQVYKLCLLGSIDKDIADFFNVCEATINNWKLVHPEFLESIRKGKSMADADVALSLNKRANGYSHDDVHISSYQGKITVTKITKHYPPDTPAALAWLKNRQPDKWRDKHEIEIPGAEVHITVTPPKPIVESKDD